MRRTITFLLFVCAFAVFIAGCNMPGRPTPTGEFPDVGTIVAETSTAIAQSALDTATAAEGQITPLAEQTGTAQPTGDTPAGEATPTATAEPECTNRAALVAETVRDETVFSSGERFTKTWELRNEGTCTWTPEYRLVHVQGNTLGYDNEDPVQLEASVSPQEAIVITASLTAPQQPGDYEAYFKLQPPSGDSFGLGDQGETPFWTKIGVTDAGGALGLGPPTYQDDFEEDRNEWYLGRDDEISFEIEDGRLVLTAYEAVGDRWRVVNEPALDDFYLEMTVETGEDCSGKDSYGFLVRSPDENDPVIDTGYVFGFSCDGHYRYYRMDGGVYTGLANWTPTAQLETGPGQTNTVGVRAQDSTFQIHINEVMVEEFSDNAYTSGRFGLFVRTVDSPEFQVQVERLAYWLLE